MEGTAEGSKGVQGWFGEDGGILVDLRRRREASIGSKGLEIESMITDGYCGTGDRVRAGRDDAKGDVGDGEGRVGSDVEPRHGEFDEDDVELEGEENDEKSNNECLVSQIILSPRELCEVCLLFIPPSSELNANAGASRSVRGGLAGHFQ